MDILVVSYGGVGTTEIIQKLISVGVNTNHPGDLDGLKHIPDPTTFVRKPKKAIYMFDCPILANKSHFRRGWFADQVRKTSGGKNSVPDDYTWEQFVHDNKDWCMMEQHWDNWINADFPVLFLRLSDAHKHNDIVSKFVGLNTVLPFFTKRERNCKLLESDKITVYDNLIEKQSVIEGFKIVKAKNFIYE